MASTLTKARVPAKLLGPPRHAAPRRVSGFTLGPFVMTTVRPSSILRAPDDETRRAKMRRFVADLNKDRSYHFVASEASGELFKIGQGLGLAALRIASPYS